MQMSVDDFTQDVLTRSRWAFDNNDGHPKQAWSAGERLAVALVLDDEHTFFAMFPPRRNFARWRDFVEWYDGSHKEAAKLVCLSLVNPPDDVTAWATAWVGGLRAALDRGRCDNCGNEPAIRRYRALALGAGCLMHARHIDDTPSIRHR